MAIVKKPRDVSRVWQKRSEGVFVFNLADYLPDCDLKTWWIQKSSDGDNAIGDGHSIRTDRHVSDHRRPINDVALRQLSDSLIRDMLAVDLLLRLLSWGDYHYGGQPIMGLGWCGTRRCNCMGRRIDHRIVH